MRILPKREAKIFHWIFSKGKGEKNLCKSPMGRRSRLCSGQRKQRASEEHSDHPPVLHESPKKKTLFSFPKEQNKRPKKDGEDHLQPTLQALMTFIRNGPTIIRRRRWRRSHVYDTLINLGVGGCGYRYWFLEDEKENNREKGLKAKEGTQDMVVASDSTPINTRQERRQRFYSPTLLIQHCSFSVTLFYFNSKVTPMFLLP